MHRFTLRDYAIVTYFRSKPKILKRVGITFKKLNIMNREEYKKEAKSTIDEVFNQINELEAKKENAKEEVKASYNEKLAELKAKRDEMQTKYEDLLTSSEDKWEEVRDIFFNFFTPVVECQDSCC